jgi:hypothetical protein
MRHGDTAVRHHDHKIPQTQFDSCTR